MHSPEYFGKISNYNQCFGNDEMKKVNLLIFKYDDNQT